jgi:hypothetical protein
MKKVTLNADELRVESFPTASLEVLRGTVDAQATGHTCVIETRCAARSCVSFGAATCLCDAF